MHMTSLCLEQFPVFLLLNSLNYGFALLINHHMLQLLLIGPIWNYPFDLSQHFRKIALPYNSLFIHIEYLHDI